MMDEVASPSFRGVVVCGNRSARALHCETACEQLQSFYGFDQDLGGVVLVSISGSTFDIQMIECRAVAERVTESADTFHHTL